MILQGNQINSCLDATTSDPQKPRDLLRSLPEDFLGQNSWSLANPQAAWAQNQTTVSSFLQVPQIQAVPVFIDGRP